jgi:ABC-2 type transport system ATP-binding protein
VAGFDVVTETSRIRRVMNMVSGGERSGYGILTVREQLWMFSQFHGLGTREGWRRTDELIDLIGRGWRASAGPSCASPPRTCWRVSTTRCC